MGGRGGSGRASAPSASKSIEDQIRAAYADLATSETGGFVGLADLRDKLGDGLARDEVDAALRAMERQEGVRIIPVANTKSLTPRDKVAGLVIGIDASGRPEVNHAISIERPKKK
jgi:hypothetical protein